MTPHELLLIGAAFVAGFGTRVLLVIWADRRAKPYHDGWQKSHDLAMNCQLREAYRAGQDNVTQHLQTIEAPTPYRF